MRLYTFDRLMVGILALLGLTIAFVVAVGDRVGVSIIAVQPIDNSQPAVSTSIRVTFS